MRSGPLTAYLSGIAGVPDLEQFVARLPAEEPVVWLDSARTHPVTGRWSLVGCRPWLRLVSRAGRLSLRTSAATHVWRGDPLEALRRTLRRYAGRPSLAHPALRALGLLGWLSYEANGWIERLPPPRGGEPDVPEMAWYGMRAVVLVDHLEQHSWLISLVDPHLPAGAARREAADTLAWLTEAVAGDACQDSPACEASWAPGLPDPMLPQRAFEAMVRRVLAHVRAGDIYQANVSQRFAGRWAGAGRALYRVLRRVNPSPFAGYLAGEGTEIISCSPERLVRVQEGRVDTRPIAGTRPRGATAEADAVAGFELLLSEKERAEHVMLVDLARNDLGRICRAGSVRVSDLMILEAYSHVLHIVSDVAGTLAPGRDAVDVVRALFPGGTITGCPKVRCMEILRDVEPVARGLYTGSFGYLAYDGTLDLNIAIRTMVLRQGRLTFHVGAGIVADSEPAREYAETLAKGAALMAALRQADPARAAAHGAR